MNPTPTPASRRIYLVTNLCLGISIMSVLVSMMPAAGPNLNSAGEFNYRIPPRWSPEQEGYSFRSYITDLLLWLVLTDLQPHQQAAAITMRLGGSARDLARTMSPLELIHGGVANGVQLDPVSYLIQGLQARYALLDDESRLAAMTEMLAFGRKPGESVNAVLTRYAITRQRARNEGQFVMSVEGCALQLLRAVNVNHNELIQFLQPTQGRLPTTEFEFTNLQSAMRRIGHIAEHSPNNIASSLAGNRPPRPGAYPTIPQQAAQSQAGSFQSFFG